MMKLLKISTIIVLLLPFFCLSQSKKAPAKSKSGKKTSSAVFRQKDNVPALIPHKKGNKLGYVNQQKKYVVQPIYDIAMFFSEDCNLLNSKNEAARKYGTANFATVEQNKIVYRINAAGKRVYTYRSEDLGLCREPYKPQKYNAYILDGKYGIIDREKFKDPNDKSQYTVYPQYQYLFILEGKDYEHPMIIAADNDRFGVIDINNKVIVPLQYHDIKRNYSWKIAGLFEVTKDDKTYFYIDTDNKAY
ncbi:hypothetical protein ASG01_04025 [Chryseobacterium sp. Leaf180]|uniref:WG repeat-containing protein n=1 Tax=Chryseobacterium sp. Leaf180 TaxID=1736289 RepID=UPI00070085C9|nr:WG repeat-containing protein [Chryseobacterium sp. Leaf180]KQR95030.1 hypothetical protein ASG01_04025 [Chryseobacterium sp. Leaf180]